MGDAQSHPMCGFERQFRESGPVPDHREAVVKYVEEDELLATGQWLLRMNEAGVSDELLFVPSELTRMGVAPKDVADQIEWLKQHRPGFDQPTSVLPAVPVVARGVAVVGGATMIGVPDRESKIMEPEAIVVEPDFDYDGEQNWAWLRPVEEMIEGSRLDITTVVKGLPSFNALVARVQSAQPEPEPDPAPQQAQPQVRTRGKRARAALAAMTQSE